MSILGEEKAPFYGSGKKGDLSFEFGLRDCCNMVSEGEKNVGIFSTITIYIIYILYYYIMYTYIHYIFTYIYIYRIQSTFKHLYIFDCSIVLHLLDEIFCLSAGICCTGMFIHTLRHCRHPVAVCSGARFFCSWFLLHFLSSSLLLGVCLFSLLPLRLL